VDRSLRRLVLRGDVTLRKRSFRVGDRSEVAAAAPVDVAAAVGLAAAVRLTMNELADVNDRVLDLQEKLVAPCVSSPDARFRSR